MKHTIPDIPGDLADEYSVYAYWRDINLLDYFVTMPSTARKYFILHLTADWLPGFPVQIYCNRRSIMDKIVSKIAGLGVPGLVLMVAINAAGLAGAAAITSILALDWPS